MNEKKSRENKNFVMYFRPFMDELTKMAGENYTAYRVFQLICKNMDGTNALVISMNALSEIMQLSRQSISKAVKYLKENGWIDVLKSGTSNVYVVNPDVAWTSYGEQKAYCKFNANVLLCASENTEYLKNPRATTRFKTIDDEFIRSVQEKKEEFEKQYNQN